MKPSNIPRSRSRPQSLRGSFTLWDLIVVIAVVFFLGGWFAFVHSGERGRVIRCARNLERLGDSMQSYAKDHDDGIPAATILLGGRGNTWRTDMAPYLKAGLQKPESIYERKTFLNELEPFFACPSDTIHRSGLCSYAMSAHDMSLDNWPPSSDNKTGMGLWWDRATVSVLLDAETVRSVTNNPELLPKLKLSVLSDPANTLLLTEFINHNNTMESTSFAWVGQVAQQQAAFRDDPSLFHFGRFNYLMADGHVELLTALQTGGIGDSPSGIWTIKAGD